MQIFKLTHSYNEELFCNTHSAWRGLGGAPTWQWRVRWLPHCGSPLLPVLGDFWTLSVMVEGDRSPTTGAAVRWPSLGAWWQLRKVGGMLWGMGAR